jgi:hypothetical protein
MGPLPSSWLRSPSCRSPKQSAVSGEAIRPNLGWADCVHPDHAELTVGARWTSYRLTKRNCCEAYSRRTDVQQRRAGRAGAYAACRS